MRELAAVSVESSPTANTHLIVGGKRLRHAINVPTFSACFGFVAVGEMDPWVQFPACLGTVGGSETTHLHLFLFWFVNFLDLHSALFS
jgi:hypothetical protein